MANENSNSGRKERSTIHVSIVTPYEIFYDGNCELLIVSASDGELGVMRNHMPMVTALYPGELRMLTENGWKYCFTSNGYVQIEREYAIVVCTAAEWSEEIDETRAHEALQRAEKHLQREDLSYADRKRALHAIRRSKMRMKVLQLFHERREQDGHDT